MDKKNTYYWLAFSLNVLSIFFLVNIFTGWLMKGPVCSFMTENCTLWRSIYYLRTDASKVPGPITDEKFAKILLNSKEKFIKEMQNNTSTIELVETFDKELSSKENLAILITSLANDDEIKAIRKKDVLLKEEEEVIRVFADEAIYRQFQKYVEEGKIALIEKNTKILEKIMPTFVNYNDYVRFFDKLQSNINTPQRPFKIENISVKDSPSQESFSDTLQIDFSLETTEDAFKEFLKAIYASGNLTMISSETKLLYPFLSIDEMKITFPEELKQANNSEISSKMIHADMKLLAYLKAISEEDIDKITSEIHSIEEKYSSKDAFKNVSEEKKLKKENLLQYKSSYETLANNALKAKEYRTAFSNFSNVKQIVTDIYNLSL